MAALGRINHQCDDCVNGNQHAHRLDQEADPGAGLEQFHERENENGEVQQKHRINRLFNSNLNRHEELQIQVQGIKEKSRMK